MPPHAASSSRRTKFLPWIVIAAGFVAYLNSFQGIFILDDKDYIFSPGQYWQIFAKGTERPLAVLTFYLNSFFGSTNPFSYHVFNLFIHLSASAVLWAVLNRTFKQKSIPAAYHSRSEFFATAISLLWVVHPLNTQSVTYIVQRCESMMGLFLLLSLYSVIRAAGNPKQRRWPWIAFLSCLAGMMVKPVMAMAPAVIFLYDRAFLSASYPEVLRKRKRIYAAMALSWVVLLYLLAAFPYKHSAGFETTGISPVRYALTQTEVIARYVSLSFWPDPLIFDYGWPLANGWLEVWPWLLAISVLAVSILLVWRINKAAAYPGIWFFLILLPTSSFIPIGDAIFEYRMYLPLAGLLAWAVLGLDILLRGRNKVLAALVAACAVLLGFQTIRRNNDYRSEKRMWLDTLAKQPENPRALANLGVVLYGEGKTREAIEAFRVSLEMHPQGVDTRRNLGKIYMQLGLALLRSGKGAQGVAMLEQTVALDPQYADAHYNYGIALTQMGRPEEGRKELKKALQLAENDRAKKSVWLDKIRAFGLELP